MKLAKKIFGVITVAILMATIGCTENNPAMSAPDKVERFSMVTSVVEGVYQDTFYIGQNIFAMVHDTMVEIVDPGDSVQFTKWFDVNELGESQVYIGGPATGQLRYDEAGMYTPECWVTLASGDIQKVFKSIFVVALPDTNDTVVVTSADSIFMLLNATDNGDGTDAVTFGAHEALFTDATIACYEGSNTPDGWGTPYAFTTVSSNMLSGSLEVADGDTIEIRYGKNIVGGVMDEVMSGPIKPSKFYDPTKDILRAFYMDGVIYPLDSIPIVIEEPFVFPYTYGDTDTAAWVCGFTETADKDTIIIYSNLSLTGETTGPANLINKQTGAKTPLTVNVDGGYGYCSIPVDGMEPELVWSYECNGVEIPLIDLKKSTFYDANREALAGRWVQGVSRGRNFVPR